MDSEVQPDASRAIPPGLGLSETEREDDIDTKLSFDFEAPPLPPIADRRRWAVVPGPLGFPKQILPL